MKIFVGSADILSGNSRLICLLCAQIFDKFKGMKKILKDEISQVQALYGDDEEDRNTSAAAVSPEGSAHGVVVTPPLPIDGGDQKQNEFGPHFADPNSPGNSKYKAGDWDTKTGKSKKNRFIHINSSSTSRSGKSNEFSEANMTEIVQVLFVFLSLSVS